MAVKQGKNSQTERKDTSLLNSERTVGLVPKKATKKLSVKQRKNRGEIPKKATRKSSDKQTKNRRESG
jgi:hypothetical protein